MKDKKFKPQKVEDIVGDFTLSKISIVKKSKEIINMDSEHIKELFFSN